MTTLPTDVIKSDGEVRRFEEQFLREENLSVKQRFAILDGLYSSLIARYQGDH